MNTLIAGAAIADITPQKSIHLSGYPFVERNSSGVHDKLLSSALYLSDGNEQIIFIGNDVIFIGKELTTIARKRIHKHTGVLEQNIMITATHTHSSPSTITFASGSHDALLPDVDQDYMQLLEDGIVKAAVEAVNNTQKAELKFSIADATGIGTNRHDPAGASNLQVPVILVNSAETNEAIACMIIVSMHPTVLHEDSTLVSGDFPGIARLQLQQQIFKKGIPVIYHTGTAANQSPRHVTKDNTFKEAERIAGILTTAVAKSLSNVETLTDSSIKVFQKFIALPKRKMPGIDEAAVYENKCSVILNELRNSKADPRQIRSAEVNWFGATETLNLAKMAANGELESVYKTCLPAEIQIFSIGQFNFVAWPGEIFVEYGLALQNDCKNTFAISLANGDLQVYIVTKDAVEKGIYEASNSIFDYKSGDILIKETIHLLKR